MSQVARYLLCATLKCNLSFLSLDISNGKLLKTFKAEEVTHFCIQDLLLVYVICLYVLY